MIVASIAVTLPLIIGYSNDQMGVSVYGALMGYLLALNDHLGKLIQRIQIVSFTFVALLFGFALGFWAKENLLFFYPLFPVLIYGVGLLGGEGAEAERALLFLVISIVISFSAKPLSPDSLRLLFQYALIAFFTVMIAIPLLLKIRRHTPEPFTGFRNNLKKSMNLVLTKHIHAFSYASAAMFALWFAQYFQMERGYWVIITVLLVMRADRTLSIFTSFQRLLGTAFGVLAFDIILLFHPHPAFLIAWAGACSFLVPLSLKRNYVLASFFITTFVVALLEVGRTQQGAYASDVVTPFLRLKATFIGCSISILGTAFSALLSTLVNHIWLRRSGSATASK